MNILLITFDQMRADAVGNSAPGTPLKEALADTIRTPHLTQLALDGACFTGCHSTAPVCVPARIAITTGRYPHRASGSKGNNGVIRAGEPLVAQHFADNGYATAAFGKLHYLPYARPGEPRTVHGFQHCELHEEGRIIGRDGPKGDVAGLEDYHDWLAETPWKGYDRAHGIGNNDVKPASSALPAEFNEASWCIDRTINWLDKREASGTKKPFFIWTSFTRPHAPFDPPRPWDTAYDPREVPAPQPDWLEAQTIHEGRDREVAGRFIRHGWNYLPPQAVQVIRAHYCGLVSFLDEQVGRLLNYLEAHDLSDDTLVAFTSDHGEQLGDMGCFLKACFFEDSVKVPLIIRFPGKDSRKRGVVNPSLVGLHDLLPTFCSAAGIPTPDDLDGRDLGPLTIDPQAAVRQSIVSQVSSSLGDKAMIRRGNWKYVYCSGGPTEELYDLDSPEGEQVNRINDPACKETGDALRQELIQWCIDNHDHQMLSGENLAVKPIDDNGEPPKFTPGALGWRWF